MPNTTDLTTLSDAELLDLRLAVGTEQERRDRLTAAPTEVAQIAQRFVEDGGDKAVLVAALDGPVEPEASA